MLRGVPTDDDGNGNRSVIHPANVLAYRPSLDLMVPSGLTMSAICFDLHCHSLASDGALPPAELVARAADYGVDVLALTDHDTLDGLEEAHQAAGSLPLTMVDGIELSVRHNGRELHVLGLWLDRGSDALQQRVAQQQAARLERAKQIGQRLDRAAGLANTYDNACALAGSSLPGRPWFAKVLVEKGRARNIRHAFNRYLKQGQSAYVSTPWCNLEEGVTAIHAAGGEAVLAHPHAYNMTRKKLRQCLQAFKEAGGDGLEVAMPGLSSHQTALLNECWQHFELKVSAGSDFHSPEQKWLALGKVPPLPYGATPVWQGRL